VWIARNPFKSKELAKRCGTIHLQVTRRSRTQLGSNTILRCYDPEDAVMVIDDLFRMKQE
jgi:hypothetical protein